MQTFLSWFFDTADSSSITYGLTVWRWTGDNSRFELIQKESSKIDVYSVVKTICDQQLVDSPVTHILEETADMKVIERQLRQLTKPLSIETVAREGTVREQILGYAPLMDSERFLVSNDFRTVPDLIFSDISLDNLIDPLLWDEPSSNTLTQSLLIALPALNRKFRNPPLSGKYLPFVIHNW